MADLTSLYRKNPKRDLAIQTSIDCINFISTKYPKMFIEGNFTDFFDIIGGTQPPKSKFIYSEKEGFIRFLQIRDFTNEETQTFIPENKNNKLCNKEDILLGRYGASIGKILTGKSGAYNVACAKVSILNPDIIGSDYLFYWLHNSKFQSDIKSFSRSAQGGFNKSDLSRIKIKLPNKRLQSDFVGLLRYIDQSIVSNIKPTLEFDSKDVVFLDVLKMIDKFLFLINDFEKLNIEYKHQLTLLDSLNQAILQEAVQGKLVKAPSPLERAGGEADEPASELLQGIKAEKLKRHGVSTRAKNEKPLPPIKPEEIPFKIPENWVWCRLGEIIELVSGQDFSPSEYSDIDNEGTPYLTGASNLDDGKIILNRWTKTPKSIAVEGDLLLTCKGSGVGKNALLKIEKAHIARQLMAIRPYVGEVKYLQFIIQLEIEQFRSKAKSQIPGIDRDIVQLTKVPLPPLSEQKRIVAEIEKQLAKTKALKEHIIANQQATEQLLKALLHQAFEVGEAETEEPLGMVAEPGVKYGESG